MGQEPRWTNTPMMRMLIIATVTALGSAGAKDYWVSEIHPIVQSYAIFVMNRSLSPASTLNRQRSGSWWDFLGRRAAPRDRFVVATPVEENDTERDRSMKGQWFCVAAETRTI